MSDYKIDFNRGNDSNDGITAPWQNLSKLASATLNSGDNVLLANDSIWDITAHVVPGTVAGVDGSPVTFSNYDPGGIPFQKPTIYFRRSLLTTDWTYDAPNNAWYYDIGYDPGWGSYVLLGGQWGLRQEASLPLSSVDRAWINNSTRFYVYAPSGQNPTTYYGSVIVGPHFRGALNFSNDGNNVIVENIQSQYGALINCFSSSGTRNYIFRNLYSENTGIMMFLNTSTAGAMYVTVDGVVAQNGITGFIHAQDTGGLGFAAMTIKNCNLSNGNNGYPQGAIYSQLRSSHIIKNNKIASMKYGTSLHTSDGCGIYVETGSNLASVENNFIEKCHLAMQDNSGRTARFSGNVIKDCFAAMKLTDASSVGSTSHTFENNTIINGGFNIKRQGPNDVNGNGWYSDQNSMAVTIRNNIFHGNSTQPAIEIGALATGTISDNNYFGYSSFALRFDGAASPITPTGTQNVDPGFDNYYKPVSSLLTGVTASGTDFYGQSMSTCLGAVQDFGQSRSVSARTVTTNSVTARSVQIRRAA